MEQLVSLAKRRGFIYPGSDIYGGLAGTYDYGPLGVVLKNNIKKSWIEKFVGTREDMYLMDAAILMNPQVWQATGHADHFSDPMVECIKCKKRYRTDQLDGTTCPSCGGAFGPERQFNMMLETKMGAVEDSASVTYLRPETAQGMFVNFKNVVDTMAPKMPFGMAQIGKAFRNEITPRDFIFRVREFEQMEIEYFVHPDEWERYFNYWKDEMMEWIESIGIDMNRLHDVEIGPDDRAHYSARTVDFEFDYPFGQKELYGLAYRGDYDLTKHATASKQKLQYTDQEKNETFVPHVIEPSFGLDRTVLAILLSAYTVDTVNDEERTYLNLPAHIAPFQMAVSPLLKNKPELTDVARRVFRTLKDTFHNVAWDDNGNIGKRYRRQDEIGTPYCVVIDFETLDDGMVSVRDRNTTEQTRIAIDDLVQHFINVLTQ